MSFSLVHLSIYFLCHFSFAHLSILFSCYFEFAHLSFILPFPKHFIIQPKHKKLLIGLGYYPYARSLTFGIRIRTSTSSWRFMCPRCYSVLPGYYLCMQVILLYSIKSGFPLNTVVTLPVFLET